MELEGPVTLVVRLHARPRKDAVFEEWLQGISRESLQQDGCLGLNVNRPAHRNQPDYTVFIRFDTFSNLEKWEHSEKRRQWLIRGESLRTQDSMLQRHTGLDIRFTPQFGISQPPRYKMIVVVLLAIYPLVLLTQLEPNQ